MIEFMEKWANSLRHKLKRAEMLTAIGSPDPKFKEVQKEVRDFHQVVVYLQTLKWQSEIEEVAREDARTHGNGKAKDDGAPLPVRKAQTGAGDSLSDGIHNREPST